MKIDEYYNTKPKNSLATIEYIKKYSLEDLKRNYMIDDKKQDFGYLLYHTSDGENLNILIHRECKLLGIDKNFNLLFWCGEFERDVLDENSPILGSEISCFKNPQFDRYVSLYFHEGKWQSCTTCAVAVSLENNDEPDFKDLKTKCFIFHAVFEDNSTTLVFNRIFDILTVFDEKKQ